MTNVSYSGSGIAAPDPSNVGQGQGLQVGQTEVDFAKGTVSLIANSSQSQLIGNFTGLKSSGAKDNNIRSIVFKAKTKCTIKIDASLFLYETVNEWITFSRINTSRIQIIRSATGIIPDVFDWVFQASDDPLYQFTIQNSTRDSETETVFAVQQYSNTLNSQGLGAGVYANPSNLRGAKKIQVFLNTANLGETGNVTVTAEIFDPASQQWINLIPANEMFNAVPANKFQSQQFGDGISRPITPTNTEGLHLVETGGSGGIYSASNPPTLANGFDGNIPLIAPIGYVLPTGDNVFRIKIVVATAPLTLSIGILKVF